MKLPLRQHIRGFVIGFVGISTLLLMTACAGVAGVSEQNSSLPGTTNAGGVTSSSGGGNGSSSTTFVPVSLSFIGQVQSVISTSIAVILPDGSSSFTANITAQTEVKDFTGTPTQG